MLTNLEREFLAAFIYEATTDPFRGPATEELHRRNIYYNDLSDLMAAYYLESLGDRGGIPPQATSVPPSCPWPNREAAAHRNGEVHLELETAAHHAAS